MTSINSSTPWSKSLLFDLPTELLDSIYTRLNKREQRSLALSSKTLYHLIVPYLYHSIDLVDCCNQRTGDHHDDTPIVRILLVLARNPYLASKCQNIGHHCYLQFHDHLIDDVVLHTCGATLSHDLRILQLLCLAISNLVNVHTLRIEFSHGTLAAGLVRGFMNERRKGTPLRRLWIESCCFDGMNRLGPINQKYLGGLESLRIKTFASYREPKLYKPQRMYSNTLSRSGNGLHVRYGLDIARLIVNNLQEEKRLEKVWDEAIFSKFPEICEVLGDYLPKSSQSLGNIDITILDDLEVPDPRVVGLVSTLLEASSSTLKYIDLDWIFGPHGCIPLYHQLNSIRFNNLRALQVRNSALLEAGPELFLLHEGLFGFLGRHSGIQCLGWPIDRFFAPSAESNIVQDPDFCNVVSTLGRTLKELRLGTTFGKSLDGAGTESIGKEAWESRRLFIEHFATYMLVLNVLKFRGTVPTLETQNLIHALKRCPIQKLVLEGSFDNLPWGLASHKHFQDGITNGPPDNEERRTWKFPILDKELKQHDGLSEIWKLVARFWSATITDIKIRRIDDTDSFVTKYPNWGRDFRPLQSLHQLRYFAIPILLDTTFESKVRNKEVVAYWHDAQRPTSTALAIPAGVEIENVWAKALRQWYSPDKLAAHVASLIGRYLSPQAKARYGGVTICALLTLKPSPGSSSHVVYELRVGVGEMNQPLWFDGPVTRGERRKSRDKFKARQWF